MPYSHTKGVYPRHRTVVPEVSLSSGNALSLEVGRFAVNENRPLGDYPCLMEPIRIACVRYLNTLPLVHGLDRIDGVQLAPTVPSRIASQVARGQADLGLASIIDAAREGLALVPVGMIGSDGPTHTVRLFSRVPLASIGRVHADVESHTSTTLCAMVLEQTHAVRPEFVDFDARERIERTPEGAAPRPLSEQAWPETMLLIGDKVVADAPPASEYLHQLDLGLAWHELTGLPMVYAMWMCAPDRIDHDSTRLGAALLDRQRRRNARRLDWIVSHYASAHDWPVAEARRYVRDLLRYDVGEREMEAVRVFLRMAAEQGLAPDRPLSVAQTPLAPV